MAPRLRPRPSRSSSPAGSTSPRSPTSISASTSGRHVRGINRGRGLECLINKSGGHPLNLTISTERRPVGENSGLLSREIGLLVRRHAPVCCTSWQDVPTNDKQSLRELLKLKFNLDFTQDHVNGCVELLFASSYKCFRHKCYEHYLNIRGGEAARTHPYKYLTNHVDDWIWLCDYFESPAFQKRSSIGKANRSRLQYVHRKGTKSFVALHHELNCGEIALYKECYQNQKGWASMDARDKYAKMVELQEGTRQDEASLTVTDL